jgi:hypothetical protein
MRRGKRIGIAVGVTLGAVGALAAGISVASLNAAWEDF